MLDRIIAINEGNRVCWGKQQICKMSYNNVQCRVLFPDEKWPQCEISLFQSRKSVRVSICASVYVSVLVRKELQ